MNDAIKRIVYNCVALPTGILPTSKEELDNNALLQSMVNLIEEFADCDEGVDYIRYLHLDAKKIMAEYHRIFKTDRE